MEKGTELNELRALIEKEVKIQMEAIRTDVTSVIKQNKEQSAMLLMQVKKINDVENWQRKLWGNGSGPPGYLETARAEDTRRYDQLLEVVSELRSERLREEGKEQLREQLRKAEIALETHKAELASHEAATISSRWSKWKVWASLFGMAGGAWGFTLVRPLIKALVELALKALGGK